MRSSLSRAMPAVMFNSRLTEHWVFPWPVSVLAVAVGQSVASGRISMHALTFSPSSGVLS
eukprot:scaffold650_cov407-Prasinococcus_capsulatus_cf.AAC.35